VRIIPDQLIIGGTTVSLLGSVVTWTSGLAIDVDGAPTAYAPLASGLPALDNLHNAGSGTKWPGLVCNSEGHPLVQGADGLAPGYYMTETALCDRKYGRNDQRRYVDASTVPYVVMPPELRQMMVGVGDVAIVSYGSMSCSAVVGDVGPHRKIGEGSAALAKALGINSDARHGGVASGVTFRIFAASSLGWPRKQEDIVAQVESYGAPAIV